MPPRVKRRTVLVLALAALAAGYVVHSVVQREPPNAAADLSRRSPEGAKTGASRPVAPRPRFTAPRDRPLFVVLGRDEFARWYRAQAPGLGLPAVADDDVLGGFATDVIEPLGRIPRPRILRVLLAEYRSYAARRTKPEEFFESLRGRVAHSDLALIAFSERWDVLAPPLAEEGPAGVHPYDGPVPQAIAKFERRLAPWYLAYRLELDLPQRNAEFLDQFQWEVLQWLGRLPKPELLRALVEAFTPLQQRWNQRTMADSDQAVRSFFAALRRRLPKADYARITGSVMWKDDCELLDIPRD
jgi:hypothetical protein